MGRALYSQSYASPAAVAIHTEPEICPQPCEPWSSWNNFDPDSEEFFQDAEYEAFIDPVQYAREQLASIQADIRDADGDAASDASESSDGSSLPGNMGVNSPLAEGADHPAVLMARIYTERVSSWTQGSADRESPADQEWSQQPSLLVDTGISAMSPLFRSPASESSPAFIPPPFDRDARVPTLRRMPPMTPIAITRTQTQTTVSDADDINFTMRSPSPDASSPSTPSRASDVFMPPRDLLTPSPPPSVSPRFYGWRHIATPTSPTRSPGVPREGPLTNPRARTSYIRIDAPPARIVRA